MLANTASSLLCPALSRGGGAETNGDDSRTFHDSDRGENLGPDHTTVLEALCIWTHLFSEVMNASVYPSTWKALDDIRTHKVGRIAH